MRNCFSGISNLPMIEFSIADGSNNSGAPLLGKEMGRFGRAESIILNSLKPVSELEAQ